MECLEGVVTFNNILTRNAYTLVCMNSLLAPKIFYTTRKIALSLSYQSLKKISQPISDLQRFP